VHVIVADAMQELQVAEPVVLVVTVFMAAIIHPLP
jgi:hypothetical protein